MHCSAHEMSKTSRKGLSERIKGGLGIPFYIIDYPGFTGLVTPRLSIESICMVIKKQAHLSII
jgi:hypothetical protein